MSTTTTTPTTPTPPEVKAAPISLTPNAIAKVKGIMAQQNPAPAGLRVGVVGGGCSGFSYSLQFDTSAGMMDKVFDMDGLKVFVDATSIMYLNGCRVDYVETLEGAGFKFENPNVKSTCGCGSSFRVDRARIAAKPPMVTSNTGASDPPDALDLNLPTHRVANGLTGSLVLPDWPRLQIDVHHVRLIGKIVQVDPLEHDVVDRSAGRLHHGAHIVKALVGLGIFADHRLKVVGIPTDAKGMIIEALAEALKRERPAFVYTIPTFQNPTGSTLPPGRREQLVALSRAYNFLLIADEVYHCLHFDAPPPRPLAAHTAEGNIVSLGSFSKILAPGLRLGWLQGPPPIMQRLVLSGVVDSGGGLNPLPSAVVRTVLEQGRLQSFVDQLRLTYRARARALSAALRYELHEWVTFNEPEGGFFLWAQMPEAIDASQLRAEGERFKVSFQPGERCSTRGGQRNCMRLSYAYYDVPYLEDGVSRLHALLNAHTRA